MPENLFDQLVEQAAEQLAGEGQIDLFLYVRIEDAGFNVQTIIDAAELFNACGE
jgi:hypothetical protein